MPTVPPKPRKPYVWRGIPAPREDDPGSLFLTVEALRENVETLIGQRDLDGAAVIARDIPGDPVGTGNLELHPTKEQLLKHFSFSAYGGIMQGGSNVSYPSLGGGWVDVDSLGTAMSADPRHLSLDLVNGRISPDLPGVYMLDMVLTFGHDSSNAGRITNVRLYNYTDNIGGTGAIIGTGRNAEATSFAAAVLFTVDETDVGDWLGLQIGGGDTYTSVVMDAAAMSITGVGPYMGPLG